MNIYLHILAENPCLVTVNGNFLGEAEANTPLAFYSDERAALYFTVAPLNINSLPYSFRLDLSGTVAADIITYPKNRYEVRLKTLSHRIYLPPKLHAQETVSGYNATLFSDSYTQFAVQKEAYTFSHILPDNLTGLRLKAESVGGFPCFAVSGRLFGEYYLFVARQEPGETRIILEEFADKITQTNEKITILKLLRDIANRAYVRIVDSSTWDTLEEYHAYVDGEPKPPAAPAELPFALFQAVKCGDFSVTNSYLTPSLAKILTPKKLEDFFEDYIAIEQNRYFDLADSFVLIDRNNTAAIFIAGYKNGLIDDLTEYEF